MRAPPTSHMPLSLGTAHAVAGEISCGWYTLAELATGHAERLPVILARGREPGPTMWLTAGIHGDELTSIAVVHDLVGPALLPRLRGTLVAIPCLNPAGLHSERHDTWLDPRDPNRLFPGADHPSTRGPASLLEAAYARLFAELRASADFYIDLHCYGLQACSFAFRDRVLYRDPAELPALTTLAQRVDALCRATGLPVVNEVHGPRYVRKRLHRSTSGTAINSARIPAITIELGLTGAVDLAALQAGQVAVRNVLKNVGMLPGEVEPVVGVPQPAVDFPVMLAIAPRAPLSGFVRYRVEHGDVVRAGDVIAVLTDLHGRALAGGEVRAEADGWVIELSRSAICFQGQPLAHMAVRDDSPMLERFPTEA